ncbi:hypothetical protein ACFYS8_11780 [Kitasatospora sp. NPDC004615]|uniref:hypothetical protein n=1 Tax=Kitasatospora sp. NPDC004615 TaxID=3364017 RepID=UPI0036AE1927
MSDMVVHLDPATGLPGGTVATFLGLGSALVALCQTPCVTDYGRPAFHWYCLGCGEHSVFADERPVVRQDANSHAAECRAVPLPASTFTGVAR